MPNPNKRSRRRERRRKVARKVAGRVLSSEAAQQIVSKGAGAVASIYGTPAAGLVVSRGLETAMERGASALSVPKTKRGKKAAKKIAKKARRETAKAARQPPRETTAILAAKVASDAALVAEREGYRPRSVGAMVAPSRAEEVEPFTDELGIGPGGELIELAPPMEEEAERPFWMNPLYWAAVAGAAFLLLRKK